MRTAGHSLIICGLYQFISACANGAMALVFPKRKVCLSEMNIKACSGTTKSEQRVLRAAQFDKRLQTYKRDRSVFCPEPTCVCVCVSVERLLALHFEGKSVVSPNIASVRHQWNYSACVDQIRYLESGGRSLKLTMQLYLVPRWRMCGALPTLLYRPSWRRDNPE
jgi:hypothetical protein